MLDLVVLRGCTHIVSHGPGCADGICSAMVLKQVFPDAKVTFVNYGTKELAELQAEPGMLFCDMSPSPERASEFQQVRAIVLDHHKTAKQVTLEFEQMGLGRFADEEKDPGVSGAVLALREVYQPYCNSKLFPDAVEKLAIWVGIRDTWQRQHPMWHDACRVAAALKFCGPEDCLARRPGAWMDFWNLGGLVLKDEHRRLQETLRGAHRFSTARGTRVVLFQGLQASSDAAEQLGDQADLVVGFGLWQGDDGRLAYTYSCRSHTTFDCSRFCKSRGGGGHTKAAGFRAPICTADPNPWEYFRQLLEQHEQSKGTE